MTQPIWLVDAFADAPFTGNPAGVVILDGAVPDQWMQQVAMEMNQAETAFVERRGDAFGLRWFTPVAEVDLCGHATLASAHALWERGVVEVGAPIAFHTRSGVLPATRDAEGWITIDLPAIPLAEATVPDDLAAALGVMPSSVHGGAFDLLCVADSPEVVHALRPDLAAIARWPVRGVIVTAAGGDGVDFTSRCFFPSLGVPEDPVTGSAHCALVPYWHALTGRTAFIARQASPRGGTIRCTLDGSRVRLAGRARTTLEGVLTA